MNDKEVIELLKGEKYNFFLSKKIERIIFFKTFWIEITDLLDSIENTDYSKFEDINYAFWKLDNVLSICDNLRKEKIEKNHDTDKAIIMNLVSLAEAIYKLNNPNQTVNEALVKWFFKLVNDKLLYNIKFSQSLYEDKRNKLIVEKIEKEPKNIPALIIYLIRNDYIHNWNFTWVIFMGEKEKKELINWDKMSSFEYSDNNNSTILLEWVIECNLTYNEFLSIFLESFKLNLEKYLKNN